jgi:hypothetical protein
MTHICEPRRGAVRSRLFFALPSARGGNVPVAITREWRDRYLEKQLELFPSALVVALGTKARDRMGGIDFVYARSAAPPGCNKPEARASWAEVARLVRSRSVAHGK